MQIFESGGALAIRPAAILQRKLTMAVAVSIVAMMVSPVIAIYLLLVI